MVKGYHILLTMVLGLNLGELHGQGTGKSVLPSKPAEPEIQKPDKKAPTEGIKTKKNTERKGERKRKKRKRKKRKKEEPLVRTTDMHIAGISREYERLFLNDEDDKIRKRFVGFLVKTGKFREAQIQLEILNQNKDHTKFIQDTVKEIALIRDSEDIPREDAGPKRSKKGATKAVKPSGASVENANEARKKEKKEKGKKSK